MVILCQRTRPRRPPEPHLDIDVLLVHVEQIAQDQVTLGLVQPDNAHRHGAVHPEGLPAGDRMDTHERVFALDVLRPSMGIVPVEIGVRRPVDGGAAVDDLAEFRRQLLVRRVPAGPDGVAADRWHRVVVQVRDAGWLALVYEICMPARRAAGLAEAGCSFGGLQCGPDDRHAGDAGDLGGLWLKKLAGHIHSTHVYKRESMCVHT
ncbi:hypothetical protein VTN96DRAFT_3477 [Rasamsonia emersonii]